MYPFGMYPSAPTMDFFEFHKKYKEFMDSIKPKDDKKPNAWLASDHMQMIIGVWSILWIVGVCITMSYATALINATHHIP